MTDDASDAGRRPPAPGDLALVQAFINTIDLETGEDDISSPHELGEWLRARGLLQVDGALSSGDLRRALVLREALRTQLQANHGEALDRAAVMELTDLASGAPLRLQFALDGSVRLVAVATGIEGAIGHLLAIVYLAMATGTWQLLKVCRKDTCRWAFYDHSRNHSSTWCAMKVCGNRVKVQKYQQRRRGQGTIP